MRYYTTEIKLATWSKSNSPFLSPVVHLPEFRPHPHFPHADQSLAAAAHDLPVVRPHRGHAHVMGVQRYHRGAGTQVKHSHPEQEGGKKKKREQNTKTDASRLPWRLSINYENSSAGHPTLHFQTFKVSL